MASSNSSLSMDRHKLWTYRTQSSHCMCLNKSITFRSLFFPFFSSTLTSPALRQAGFTFVCLFVSDRFVLPGCVMVLAVVWCLVGGSLFCHQGALALLTVTPAAYWQSTGCLGSWSPAFDRPINFVENADAATWLFKLPDLVLLLFLSPFVKGCAGSWIPCWASFSPSSSSGLILFVEMN